MRPRRKQDVEPFGRSQPANSKHNPGVQACACLRKCEWKRIRNRMHSAPQVHATLPKRLVSLGQHYNSVIAFRGHPTRHPSRPSPQIFIKMAVLPSNPAHLHAYRCRHCEQRQHGIDLDEHLHTVFADEPSNASDRRQVLTFERRPRREQGVMPNVGMQREHAGFIPQTKYQHPIPLLRQRIGNHSRHALGPGKRVQRARQETDTGQGGVAHAAAMSRTGRLRHHRATPTTTATLLPRT